MREISNSHMPLDENMSGFKVGIVIAFVFLYNAAICSRSVIQGLVPFDINDKGSNAAEASVQLHGVKQL